MADLKGIANRLGVSRENLPSDLIAGLTVAVMLVPQGMAYAMLAGLPPIVGLYASTLPLIAYAFIGSSRQLAVGPVAMVSLMVASGVGAIAEVGTDRYLELAVLLALMVGVIQFAMGLLRMGFAVNFLSHPVVSGFTSAAALIIGFSQLKHLMGVDLPRSHHVHEVIGNAAASVGDTHIATVVIGVGGILILLALRRWAKKVPGALVVAVLGTLAVAVFGLDAGGVKTVGEVPAGLPALSFPALDWSAVKALLPTALAISLVGFMESVSVAKAMARRHKYDIAPNRELTGLGVANLASALVGGYPVTGGFSRTAVNDQAGAKSPVASIVTAVGVALTLLVLTPLFTALPKAVLASIIMVAVFGLVDIHEVRHLWKVNRSDLGLLVATFVATLLLGIEPGIGIGVGLSLMAHVVRSTTPHFAVLGRLPGTDVFRNVKNYPDAERVDGVVHLRIDAQFYFGNVTFLKATIAEQLAEAKARGERIRAVVIDASSVNALDSSADTALHEVYDDLSSRDIALWFACVKGPVRERMHRSGFWERLGGERFVDRIVDAAPVASGATTPASDTQETDDDDAAMSLPSVA